MLAGWVLLLLGFWVEVTSGQEVQASHIEVLITKLHLQLFPGLVVINELSPYNNRMGAVPPLWWAEWFSLVGDRHSGKSPRLVSCNRKGRLFGREDPYLPDLFTRAWAGQHMNMPPCLQGIGRTGVDEFNTDEDWRSLTQLSNKINFSERHRRCAIRNHLVELSVHHCQLVIHRPQLKVTYKYFTETGERNDAGEYQYEAITRPRLLRSAIGYFCFVAMFALDYFGVFCLFVCDFGSSVRDRWFRWSGISRFGKTGRILAGLLLLLSSVPVGLVGLHLLVPYSLQAVDAPSADSLSRRSGGAWTTFFNSFSNRRYPSGFGGRDSSLSSSALSFGFDIRATPSPDRRSVASRLRIQELSGSARHQSPCARCSGMIARQGI